VRYLANVYKCVHTRFSRLSSRVLPTFENSKVHVGIFSKYRERVYTSTTQISINHFGVNTIRFWLLLCFWI